MSEKKETGTSAEVTPSSPPEGSPTISSAWMLPPSLAGSSIVTSSSEPDLTGLSAMNSRSLPSHLVPPSVHQRLAPPQQQPHQPHRTHTASKSHPHHPPRAGHPSPPEEDHMPLPDRIAATALSGTLELLKFASGVTWNTTNKLVAPPLLVTQRILLPQLWAAAVDSLTHATPIRIKDWFRILSTSIHHLITVLKNTPRGQIFLQKVLLVLLDVVDCLSADTTRQLLMDGMSSWVKLAEALHTPQVAAWLDQMAVTACRLVDAAGSGRNKQLIHHLRSATWSGLDLWADPHTTVALAEVTAYLCYALEMEDADFHADGSAIHDTDPTTTTSSNTANKAQQRYERNAHQHQTEGKPITLGSDPMASVEDVILSSLGSRAPTNSSSGQQRVLLEARLGIKTAEGPPSPDRPAPVSSTPPHIAPRDHPDGDGSATGQSKVATVQAWHEKARSDIDVAYLTRGIHQRADAVALVSGQVPMDVEDLTREGVHSEAESLDKASAEPRPQVALAYQIDDQDEAGDETRDDTPSSTAHFPLHQAPSKQATDPSAAFGRHDDKLNRLQGETPDVHFRRVLESVLMRQRDEGVRHVLFSSSLLAAAGFAAPDAGRAEERDNDDKNQTGRETPVNQNTTKRAKPQQAHVRKLARAGSLTDVDSVKQRLQSLRAEWEQSIDAADQERMRRMKRLVQQNRAIIYLTLSLILLFLGLAASFSVYGVYKFFSPTVSSSWHQLQQKYKQDHRHTSSSGSSGELVIRLVREVVHVGPDGTILDRQPDLPVAPSWGPPSSANPVASPNSSPQERLAHCLAQAMP